MEIQSSSVNDAITAVATLLDFTYVRPGQPFIRSSIIPKLIFTTLPISLNLNTFNRAVPIICATSTSEAIFWEYIKEKLTLDDQYKPRDHRLSVSVPVALKTLKNKEEILFLPADVQLVFYYSHKTWHSFQDSLIKKSTAENYDLLASAFDAQELTHRLRRLDGWQHDGDCGEENVLQNRFRDSYHALQNWAYGGGVLSARFCMLSEECLVHLSTEAFIEGHSSPVSEETFYEGFSKLDSTAFSEFLDEQQALTLIAPSGRDLTRKINTEGARRIRELVSRARLNSIGQIRGFGLQELFLNYYQTYVDVLHRCWDPKEKAQLDSDMPELLVALQTHIREKTKSARKLAACIWPGTVSEAHQDNTREWHYLLGIYQAGPLPRHQESASSQILPSQPPPYVDELQTLIEQFLKSKMAEGPGSTSFVSADVLLQPAALALVQALSQNVPETNGNTADTMPEALRNETFTSTQEPTNEAMGPSPSPTKPTARPMDKHRMPSEVMSRLIWDPKHAGTDYEVGYVDRFEKELIWKPLDKWERLTEEEEFVPEHRIRQIRRIGDEVVVWDRMERTGRDGT